MLGLKNEFIMAPVKLGYSDGTGNVLDKHILFYERRAKYVGAIILEPLFMDKGLREIPTQLGIDSDDKEEGYKKLIDTIHKYNTKVIAHLNHPGRLVNPKILGNYHISSTDKPCPSIGAAPKKMTREDMDKVIELWVDSAKRAEKFGFDIIEIQAGHGYLLAQFLSPAVNDRDDEYGGSLENRMRFPLEVIKSVVDAVNIPVIVRLSADEMTPNGLKIDEVKVFAKELNNLGVKALHVVAGSGCDTPPWFFQHMFVPKGKIWDLAKEIKESVDLPVIFVGRINTFEDIEKLKNDYNADYLAIGRALVADPDFVGKYLGEIEDRLYKPCMACADGCLGGVKSGKGLGCVVNPLVAKKEEFEAPSKVETPKKIAIVGGGLAGSEAAVVLKERGYDVTLFEKDKIGGQFNLAALPPKKGSLVKIINYYKEKLNKLGVNIINKDVSANDLLEEGFDKVIVATGSTPFIPPIEGIDKVKYYWAEILENVPEGKKAVVIGGGLIGVEVAEALLEKGNEVIIVEMFDEIARGMEIIEKAMITKMLKEKNVLIYTKTKVTKVEEGKVYIEKESGEKEVIEGVDIIIVATGMRSNNKLAEELKENGVNVEVIGDASSVGKAKDAIEKGRLIAMSL